jgi:hypothetical protein
MKTLVIMDMQKEFIKDDELDEMQKYICNQIENGKYDNIINMVYINENGNGYSENIDSILKYSDKFKTIIKKQNDGSKELHRYFNDEIHLVGIRAKGCIADTFIGLQKFRCNVIVHKNGIDWVDNVKYKFPIVED